VVFDDNKITIDGSIDLACSDDVPARFRSYGWNVIEAGEIAEDCNALEKVLGDAASHRGAPTLVCLRTHIGTPSPDFTDKHEAHGNPFAAVGIPDEPFWAPGDLVAQYRSHCAARGAHSRASWEARLAPDVKASLDASLASPSRRDLEPHLPAFEDGQSVATRVAFQKILDATAAVLPNVIAGAADLTGNTGAKVSSPAFSRTDRSGRQVFYGIREHAMGAALVGMARHGGVIGVGGTFFVFADYMRPSIRLAALSGAKCVFVFSHDSVGVGEDGPTHQPVEHLASLRSIPGLQVIRPADARETAAAWLAALEHAGPTALILSRQNLPVVTDGSAVGPGAAFVRRTAGARAIVVATGSEVAVALEAATVLESGGIGVDVVSMPSWDRFQRLDAAARAEVFAPGVPVVSVEAATTFGWERYADACVGIDRFGASAPGQVVMERLGITASNVADTVRELLSR